MNKYLGRFLSVIAIVLFSNGCGDKGSSFSLLSEVDSFKQTEGTFNTKIDVLWVIDNSGSMDTSQQALANNFNSFIQDFVGKNLDFKMSVITTDAYRDLFNNTHKCALFRDGRRDGNCNKISGATYSNIPVIDSLTANIQSTFSINALQGVVGTGDERAFASLEQALLEPANAGFIRPNSFVSVIIVSDEDDFSHTTASMNESYTNPNLYPINRYVNLLDSATQGSLTDRRYNVNAIAIFNDACRTTLGGGSRKIGQRYNQLIDSVNSAFTLDELKGIKGSLCGNFADDLKKIADSTLTLASRFPLARLPIPSSIAVRVDGVVVPNKDTNPSANGGWIYEVATNSILFVGSNYLPQAGSNIVVNYDPQSYGQ